MNERVNVTIVGPSVRFLSGISYYTIQLSNALSERANMQAILFRHMMPRHLFPGRKRVGDDLATVSFKQQVTVCEMLDWYNVFSWVHAARQMRGRDVVIFEWWTSSVAHMYLALQLLLHQKVPVIIEFHEIVDPLEQSILPIRVYSRIMGRIIRQFANHYVVHSEADRELVRQMYSIPSDRITIIPHGLYDQYPILEKSAARRKLGIHEENIILFFGLLRPYKGIKYLIEAFNTLPENLLRSSRLMIVGEAWEDCESLALAEASPYREKISIVNRYIGDDEIPFYFSAADVLVLPYTRASQSGVAHIAMSYGLPIIATTVGGLEEGLHSYSGAFFISPKDSAEITESLEKIIEQKRKFPPPGELIWANIGTRWMVLLKEIDRR
jgi:glycosyltransferase involved in cell wall biosynthesis